MDVFFKERRKQAKIIQPTTALALLFDLMFMQENIVNNMNFFVLEYVSIYQLIETNNIQTNILKNVYVTYAIIKRC